MGKEYYTLKETSVKFSVCKRTVYLWVKAGKLKYIKVGNKFLIPREEIERIERGG